jgi:hypothetical protein
MKGENGMKKFILLLLLLAMVMLATSLQAQDEEELPLGSRGKGILMTDHFPTRSAGAAATMARQGKEKAGALAYPPYPYEDTFLLHSYPTSNYKLYIDFDGWKGYKAWDPAGDGAAFSDAEKLLIQKIWYLTSEDYMPFTIDVTTEEPGSGFLGMRAVVDGSGKYDYGWAYMNSWPNSNNIAYTGIWDNQWVWIAQAASHEVGHTLNVKDHGDDQTGYYMGHGQGWTAWGAIMGWDSDSIGVWDDGDYPYANNPEDSLNIIETRVGVDYRPDDHGNSIATATAVDITADLIAEGNIEQVTDVDYFSFTMAGSGDVVIAINGDLTYGIAQTNLDVLAKIHDSEGEVLYTSNPEDRLHAVFNVTLSAGDYYISVDGTGYDDPRGDPSEAYGYSDYGVLGYYSIMQYTGNTNPPTPDPMTFASSPVATGANSIEMTASTASDPNGVKYYFECTAGGGHDSGWQTGTYYEDFPLAPNTQYTYKVYARDESVGLNQTAASVDMSATTGDGDPVTNVVLPANGGVLESYTSQYSAAYGAVKLTNNITEENGWASAASPTSPQEFVYSFDSGQDATLVRAVIHGGKAEGAYYSKDVQVWTSANGTDFTLQGSDTLLNQPLDSAVIDLGDVTAKKVKLAITSGYSGSYWEMAEFQVYGAVDSTPDTTPPTPDPMTWAQVPVAGGGTAEVVDSYGFEVPDQGDSGWAYTPTGSVWTFTGGSGLSGPNGPWKCNSTSPDPLGDQFAFLQGTAAISKDLTGLTIDDVYELSFFESYRTAMASGNDLSVILDEGLGTEVTIYNNPGVTNATWESRTTSPFVAAKTSYTLTFRTTNPLGGDRSTIIDGVEVAVLGDADTTIIMTATTASDSSGVEYYFDETTGNPGGTDSGWQDETTYVDTGLNPDTTYTYTVTARDKSPAQNETEASTAESATTDSSTPDTDPPTPNPATFATPPTAVSSSEITMTATTGSDATGPVQYFFDETSGNPGGTDSGWVNDPVYNDDGLDPDTQYTYTVQMRDSVTPTPNVGTVSDPASATTDPEGQTSLTDDFEGTLANWSTDWDLVTDYYQSATHSIQCSSEDNNLTSIDVDTSGASTSVTVQFKYRISGIDANDNIRVWYWNGIEYVQIEEIGDDAENTWLTYDHTTTDAQYRISTFKISIQGASVDPGELLWIDDVSITCQ